jgi:hypothetical protein
MTTSPASPEKNQSGTTIDVWWTAARDGTCLTDDFIQATDFELPPGTVRFQASGDIDEAWETAKKLLGIVEE